MSDFFYCTVERRDLGDLLLGDGLQRVKPVSSERFEYILNGADQQKGAVFAVWPRSPLDGSLLPTALICQDELLSDFVAWITTYVARLRPLSAFMRIIGRSEFLSQMKALRPPALGRTIWPLTGLIIGEVLSSSRVSDKSLESLPLNAYESTLSFALIRASALYGESAKLDQIMELWDMVRRITRQHPRLLDVDSVGRVCSIALTAADLSAENRFVRPEDDRTVRMCREAIQGEAIPEIVLEMSGRPHLSRNLQGTREDRVVAFSEFSRSLPDRVSREDQEIFAFAIGYLASRIAPGTIQHTSILEPFSKEFPTVVLWYAFCAGLGKRESGGRQTLARLGVDLPPISKWIARDLLRDESLLSGPTCDIGSMELLALSRTGDDPLANLIRVSPGTVTVELAPAVWTVLNVSSKTEQNSVDRRTRTDRERELIARMGDRLHKLNIAFEELAAGESDDPRQSSLFPSKRKRS